jgi:hypothetical protein
VSAPRPKIAEARGSGPSVSHQFPNDAAYWVGGGVVPGVVFWGVVGGVVLDGFVVPGAGVLLPGAVSGVVLPGAVSGVGAVGAVSGVGLALGVVSGVGAVFGVVPGVVVSGVLAVPGGGAAVSGAGVAVPGVGAAVAGVCVCGVGVGCDFFGFDGVAVWAIRQIAESSRQEINVALNFIGVLLLRCDFRVSARTLGLFQLSENPADPLAPLRLSGRRDRETHGLYLRSQRPL